MSKSIQVFNNPELGEIRGFMKDGEPWFLAGEICRALGIKNASDAIAAIEQKYKNADIKGVGSSYTLLDTKGGKQRAVIIPEPFLYELIFNSRKVKAVKFRAWVTNEVLPAIRKHGFYRTESKGIRRTETDAIQQLIKHAESQGSKNANMYYTNVTKMAHSIIGIDAGERDSLSITQLQQLGIIESVILLAINEGIEQNLPYKEIYQSAKERAQSLVAAFGVRGVK